MNLLSCWYFRGVVLLRYHIYIGMNMTPISSCLPKLQYISYVILMYCANLNSVSMRASSQKLI